MTPKQIRVALDCSSIKRKDIASRAGVSCAMVSMVLYRRAKSKRVLLIAEQMLKEYYDKHLPKANKKKRSVAINNRLVEKARKFAIRANKLNKNISVSKIVEQALEEFFEKYWHKQQQEIIKNEIPFPDVNFKKL